MDADPACAKKHSGPVPAEMLDAEVNERALAKVREDKRRESAAGFDGTWVAHPDLVPVAREVFDSVLGDRPHQKHVLRQDVIPDADRLLDVRIAGGAVTETGVRNNVSVALQYLDAWLQGTGAVAIHPGRRSRDGGDGNACHLTLRELPARHDLVLRPSKEHTFEHSVS
jgi:malate synthase